jgi:aspartyl-tRNA(Asn)/glutamyl-tRNA(Gln) amidotransferase subunit B
MPYVPVIGLEVHAQLNTDSKMFCGCSAEFGADPNSKCCPVCVGLPGSLPVPNRRAIEFVIRTGLALGCEVAAECRFHRKNYFYPDLAKNFQISQYDEPLTFGGGIELEVEGEKVAIRIKRAHLEEDTGKSIHLPDGRSLVDYNRCGVPLMEVVTEPDFRSAEQVREYLLQLRSILRYLGVSTANMEEGALRAEPTVNLIDFETDERTPKVEIKNLASIKVVFEAVNYEINRQRRCLSGDCDDVMQQETRRWDDVHGVTVSMRSKESAHDYMYFPEPDLPLIAPPREWVDEIRAALPELPAARKQRLIDDLGLSEYDAAVLTGDHATADYFEAVAAACGDAKTAGNWVMGSVQSVLNETKGDIADFPVSAEALGELIKLVNSGGISNNIAKSVFEKMLATGASAAEIVAADGLQQINDAGELEAVVCKAIEANPKAVADYRAGKTKAMGAIVGMVMRETRGQANPAMLNEMVERLLAG